MKVKTLINKLLNYDMNAPVELVILGEDGERYSRYLSNNCVDESGGFDDCPIIFDTNEIKDDDESIQDLILYKHSFIDSLEKKETKQLLKEIKAYRNDMVARNYPHQQISDIITKWQKKNGKKSKKE